MIDRLDDLDAEERRREQATKPPDSLISRIREPPRGAFTKSAPRRTFLVEQVRRHIDSDGRAHEETRGVVGRGHVHILAGEGGAGKGRWILTVAAAVAAGDARTDPDPNAIHDLGKPGGMDNVCGLRVNGIGEDEKVLLILGEDDEIDFHQRCEGVAEALEMKGKSLREDRFRSRLRWASAHGLTFSIVETVKAGGEVTSRASADFDGLMVWMRENGPWGLVAMDPLSRFAGVDENDNPLQHKVFALVEEITKVNGEKHEPPAVVVVDHTAKPDKGSTTPSQHWIRGASAKVNAARVAMVMVPKGERIIVDAEGRGAEEQGFDGTLGTANIPESGVIWHHVKSNGERKADPVHLHFTQHGGLTAETETARRERRKRQWKAAEKRGEIMRPLKGSSRSSKASAPREVMSDEDLE